MDILEALAGMSLTEYGHWLAVPDGWDQWTYGVMLSEDGPVPLMAGLKGTMVVTIVDPNGATSLHPHDSAERALACWTRIASIIAWTAFVTDPRSTYAATPAPAETLALPVSTDEQTARPFGWL